MKSILFLLALITFTQCSIEKRLYRPGWHVIWKKKSHHHANLESEKIFSANKRLTFEKNSLEKDSLVESMPLTDTLAVATNLPIKQKKNRHFEAEYNSHHSIPQTLASVTSSKKDKTFTNTPQDNSEDEDAYQRNWGFIILLIGIACLLIAGLFIVIAISSPFLDAILFLIGAYIFGLLGIGLFIIGFVITLLILNQNNKLRQKKEADRLFDDTPPREREGTGDHKIKSEQTRRSNRKPGIIFALIALALFGLYALFK